MILPIIVVVVLIAVFIASQSGLFSSKTGEETQVARKASVQESQYEDIPIYYSSQTGTAERFCDLLKEDGKEFNLNTKVINLEDFNEEEFMKSKFAIFILATHYEGDPPDNAVTWTDEFIKAEGKPSLSHMKFLMYGLGDKTYKHFGGYSHIVNDELIKRGAKSVKELEIGSDHQNRIEDHFVEWKEGIFAKIRAELPFKAGQNVVEGSVEDVFSPSSPKKTNLYAPKFNITTCDESAKIVSPVDWRNTYNASNFELNSGKVVEAFESRVIKCQDIRQKDGYTGRHLTGKSLELDLEVPEGLNVDTAGNLVVYPENDEEHVNSILKRVGLDSWTIVELNKNPAQDGNNKMPFPSPIMAGEVVKRFIDLSGMLKVSTLRKLAKVVNNFEIKEALTKMTEKNNKDFVNMQNQNWCLFHLIENYNIELSLEELVDISDRIKPRFYTIASSKRVNPKIVSICITLSIDHLSDFDKTHYGLISKKFCDVQDKLKRGNTTVLRVNHQASTFHLPTDLNTNCVMIGSGAGVGPFIGMLDEKVHDIDNCEDSKYGQMNLFFGIRNSQEDFLYKDKLKS